MALTPTCAKVMICKLRQTYMQPDADGVVGFLQFWKGMEDSV